MNDFGNTNCYLVDKEYMIVFCEDLTNDHVMNLEWSFSFDNKVKNNGKKNI